MELNIRLKAPCRVNFYYLTKVVLLTFFAVLLFSLPGNQIFRQITISLMVFFIDMPVLIYLFLYYKNLSFVVREKNITINSGIIIKKSKFIPFDKVQNVSLISGPLRRLFGLTKINIWTSSPAQIRIYNQQTEHIPEGFLILCNEDAIWLQDFISRK